LCFEKKNPFIENGVLEFTEKKIFKRGFVWKVSKKILCKNIPTGQYIVLGVLDKLGHMPTCRSNTPKKLHKSIHHTQFK
jgi:hypothetical protein